MCHSESTANGYSPLTDKMLTLNNQNYQSIKLQIGAATASMQRYKNQAAFVCSGLTANIAPKYFHFFKVMLKAKIVQILFSQIHKKYERYIVQTSTVYKHIIAQQIESMTR
jgi:hypothetical protein